MLLVAAALVELREGDEQLGEGLDLARQLGQVDWDPEEGVWFVPDHAVGGGS